MMSRIKVVVKVKYVEFIFRGLLFHVYENGKVHRLDINSWLSDNRPNGDGYILFRVKGKSYKLHRLVFSALVEDVMDSPEIQVDHIDGNRLDNRITNLRRATNAENSRNRGLLSNNASGVPHISAHPRRKVWGWQIKIHYDSQPPFTKWRKVGPLPIPNPLPPIPQDLIDIRNRECRRLYGEFARIV